MNPNTILYGKSYNIRTNGTTIIKAPQNPTGKLLLIGIVVNTKGASSNVAIIYDSNATLGALEDNRKGTLDTVNTLGRIDYGILMENGIYIVTQVGTAPDMTVIYQEV